MKLLPCAIVVVVDFVFVFVFVFVVVVVVVAVDNVVLLLLLLLLHKIATGRPNDVILKETGLPKNCFFPHSILIWTHWFARQLNLGSSGFSFHFCVSVD